MSRSNWKGPYIHHSNFKDLKKREEINIHEDILKVTRSSEIVPKFVGLTFKVHNGKKHIDLVIMDKMIGHKFGEFCATRAQFLFKKKKSKK